VPTEVVSQENIEIETNRDTHGFLRVVGKRFGAVRDPILLLCHGSSAVNARSGLGRVTTHESILRMSTCTS